MSRTSSKRSYSYFSRLRSEPRRRKAPPPGQGPAKGEARLQHPAAAAPDPAPFLDAVPSLAAVGPAADF